ncbi:MAG: ABC transporter ATP-binding protein [Desulfovibrio sp.]|nr:ABC transporter ATP-binding protein [Desulfovibrio sp.]
MAARFQAATAFFQIYAQLDRPLKRRFWRVLLLSGSVSLLELVITASLSLLGIALAAPESLQQMEGIQWLVRTFPALGPVAADQKTLLVWLLAGLCGALAFKSLSLAFLTWRSADFAQAVGVFFSTRFFSLLLHAPYLWHVRQDLAMLQTRLTWARFSADFLLAALESISQLLVAVVLVAVVSFVTPWAALFVCLVTGLSAAWTFSVARRRVHQLNCISMDEEGAANRIAYPSLAGIREIKIYAQEKTFQRLFYRHRRKFSDAQTLLPVIYPAPSWFLDFTGMVMLLAALLVLGRQGLSIGELTGQLALLAAVTWRLLPTVNKLVSCLLQTHQHMVYTQDAVLFIAALEKEREQSGLPAADMERPCLPCPIGESLELKDVCFRYPETPASKPDALHGLNIRIRRGAMVGIIGSSGAGKSTVVGLLTGLLAPTAGKLMVDGQELDEAHRIGWLRSLGYVPQAPFLLNATIAENIAFSQWGEPVDRARVDKCCRMAAMDFVADLPEGLDTVIGERGVRLSGGQVQRVAIARALYENPQLILFDEATSALDGASEQAIQHTIESLGSQATLVIVAHRLTTVKNCDDLYWLGQGTVLMHGKPDEVLPAYEAYLEERAAAMEQSDKS